MKKILVVEDEKDLLYSIRRVLEREGFSTLGLDSAKDLERWVKECDLLILDIKLKGESGIEVIRKLRERGIDKPVITITAYASPENIINAMKLGAVDVLRKPFELEQLLNLVKKLLKQQRTKGFSLEVEGETIVGVSDKMLEVFKWVGLASSSSMSVLITGETGVGKEVIAKAIHQNSDRKDKPFIAINCTAIPEGLLESELFGYERGAFTGALYERKGKVELANGGTLFLDEIGDMPLNLQGKLLRFLEEKKFYRVGGSKEIEVDVRVICATNRDLKKSVKEGKFREDLYYRISQLHIRIPPLRERKEDIKPLIELFIAKANEEMGFNVVGISERALNQALNYPWRGNVRELKNVIYRAVLETKKGLIEELPLEDEVNTNEVETLIEGMVESLGISKTYEELEKTFFKVLLKRYSKSFIAKELNLARNTLRKKLRDLGLC